MTVTKDLRRLYIFTYTLLFSIYSPYMISMTRMSFCSSNEGSCNFFDLCRL